jgi:hypothetical protein
MGARAILDFRFWISDFGLTLLSAYCLLLTACCKNGGWGDFGF